MIEKWIESAKLVREWGDAIGLMLFCVLLVLGILVGLALWIRARYIRNNNKRR